MHTSLLINPPYERRPGGGVVPPIGLAYLAASLRAAGSTPAILDLAGLLPDFRLRTTSDHVEALRSTIKTHGIPDLVAIGPLVTANLIPTRDLTTIARSLGCPLIAIGGPLCAAPDFHPVFAEYLPADVYVWGDGEQAISQIVAIRHPTAMASLEYVGTKERAARSPARVQNLDELAPPDRSLCGAHYHQSARRAASSSEQHRSTAAFLSRGCPFACTFCAAPLVSGSRVRRLSRDSIVRELNACADLGFSDIVFYDDCLFVKGPRLDTTIQGFTEAVEMSDWGGTFQMEMRCDAAVAMSEDSLSRLVDAGMRQANMGIEKATTRALKALRKKLLPEVAEQAVNRLNAAGLRTAGTFILGGIGESETDIRETTRFACSLPLTFAHFNPLALYPGTQLYSSVYGEGSDWLALCLDEERAPWGDILFESDEVPLRTVLAILADGYHAFYSAERLTSQQSRLPRGEADRLGALYDTLAGPRADFLSRLNVH